MYKSGTGTRGRGHRDGCVGILFGCLVFSRTLCQTVYKFQASFFDELSFFPRAWLLCLVKCDEGWVYKLAAVYKSGTGTSGRVCGALGLGDASRGTWGHQVWDVGTCRTGTRGRQIQGRRGRGIGIIIVKVGGKCDISHFPCEYALVKATHPALLRVPPCLFTKRRLGEDPLHWRKWNRCPCLLADGILEPKAG